LISSVTAKIQFISFSHYFHSGALWDFNKLRPKCNKSFSVYFGKNLTCFTQENYFSVTHRRVLLLHCYSTQDGGGNQAEVLRDGAATYYHATVY
jgi:hypothetical protein